MKNDLPLLQTPLVTLPYKERLLLQIQLFLNDSYFSKSFICVAHCSSSHLFTQRSLNGNWDFLRDSSTSHTWEFFWVQQFYHIEILNWLQRHAILIMMIMTSQFFFVSGKHLNFWTQRVDRRGHSHILILIWSFKEMNFCWKDFGGII